MQPLDLRQTIDGVLLDIADAEPFLGAVATLSLVFDAMGEQLLVIAEGGNKLPEATAALHAKFAGLSRVTAGINPRRFYMGLDRLQQGLARLRPPLLADDKLAADMAKGVEEFATGYDAFLSRPTGKTAIPLILLARKLHDRMPLLLDALAVLRGTQEDAVAPAAGWAELNVSLPAISGLSDFAQRLMAIDSLYAEVCLVFSISRADHPLRIARIASGSLQVRALGEARAIAWLADFMRAAASFMYQNYSADARFTAAARSIESIDAALHLSQRMKDAGVDAARVPQHLQRAAPALFKDLAALLERQPSVTIDGHTVSIGDELNKVLLKGHTSRVPAYA